MECGADLLLPHPTQGGAGVGVDGAGFTFLLQQGQGMNNRQKLAQVVGAVFEGTDVEELLAGFGVDAAVFQVAGAAVAGRIDGNAVGHDFQWQGEGGRFANELFPT